MWVETLQREKTWIGLDNFTMYAVERKKNKFLEKYFGTCHLKSKFGTRISFADFKVCCPEQDDEIVKQLKIKVKYLNWFDQP